MAFTHLHVHTEYSLLDGSNKIKEYVARVKELGMNSAAITDHGVMYGVIDFYKEAMEKIVEMDDISKCQLNSDYNYTDTTRKKYRYQAVYDMVHF